MGVIRWALMIAIGLSGATASPAAVPPLTAQEAQSLTAEQMKTRLLAMLVEQTTAVGRYATVALPLPIFGAGVTLRKRPTRTDVSGRCQAVDLSLSASVDGGPNQRLSLDAIRSETTYYVVGSVGPKFDRGMSVAANRGTGGDKCSSLSARSNFFRASDSTVAAQGARLFQEALASAGKKVPAPWLDCNGDKACSKRFHHLEVNQITSISRSTCYELDAKRDPKLPPQAHCVQFEVELPGPADAGDQSGHLHRVILIADQPEDLQDPRLVGVFYGYMTWIV